MSKIIFSLFLAGIIFGQSAGADLTKPGIINLKAKLQKLVAPYGQRVGLCFIDLKTGLELEINGRDAFPAASVAKVPVMIAAFHLAEIGQTDLNNKIKFEDKYKLGGSGVLQWMKAGNEYTLWNLVRLMIVLSDNTATKMVVDHLGLEAINNYLLEIGIIQTKIVDDTMLNEPPAPNINHTTPEDMARIMVMIKQSIIFRKDSSKEMIGFMKNQRYHWGIWRGIGPGAYVADKTGVVGGVLNDAGIVYSPYGQYVLSIFTKTFQHNHEARLIINNASKIIYDFYASNNPKTISSVKKGSATSSRKSKRYVKYKR